MTAPTAVVVAPLGPNPASLTELIWALHRQRGLAVDQAFVVTHARGRYWLDREVLDTGQALDQLREVLGEVAAQERIHVHEVPEGATGDADPDGARTWREAVWQAGRQAVEAAGPRPVVFGLLGGRRRTMTAMETVIAQLLARPWDLCVDVRVSLRQAEGGSGFFFPDQPRRRLFGPRGPFDAAEVEVRLVDVPLPRLRGLLAEEHLASWGSALAAGQRAIDDLQPPALHVDLARPSITANGAPLPLRAGMLLHYAVLALARTTSEEGWVPSRSVEPLNALAPLVGGFDWTKAITSSAWEQLLVSGCTADDLDWLNVSSARSEVRRRIQRWCQQHHPAWTRWLVPVKDARWMDGAKMTRQRLPLPAARITMSTQR